MRVVHAEFFAFCVHFGNKEFLRTADLFGKGDGRVVCAGNDDAFHQFAHGIRFICVEKDLRSAHPRRFGADDDRIVQRQDFIVDRFKGQKQRHDLAHTGDRQSFGFVFGIDYRAAVEIRKICGFGDGAESFGGRGKRFRLCRLHA